MSSATSQVHSRPERLPILMPEVHHIKMGTGKLALNQACGSEGVQWLACSSPRLLRAEARLQAQVGKFLPMDINCASNSEAHPQLHCDESYQIQVTSERIYLQANSEWGILRAFSSLAQLVYKASIPACRIEDTPAYPWRGLMLDPARHFLSIGVIKETLDLMFAFKLNVLHLHLSDDQGFRFFSPSYPELALIGGENDYYSTQELKDLVNYASNRGIRIVPELDIPGHCTSWLAAHPEWGAGRCETWAGRPSQRFGGHKSCLDPSNPEVYTALNVLLEELADVFPDAYVHLGGDEVNPEWWSKHAGVKALMQTENLAELADVQNYFMMRVTKSAQALGKKVLGWDEILHPDLATSVVVQSWRTAGHRDIALNSGFDCIFSSGYYLDLFYPNDIHYGFVPDAKLSELQAQEARLLVDERLAHIQELNTWLAEFHADKRSSVNNTQQKPGEILGGEACMWAELVSEELLHTRVWSRMPAIAERLWCGAKICTNIYTRLPAIWKCMQATTDMDIYAPLHKFINRFNASDEEKRLLGVLLNNIEPVKSYARLLGDQASARVIGTEVTNERPYKQQTPLTRIVDLIPPESMSAYQNSRLIVNKEAGGEHAETAADIAADWSKQLPVVRKLLSQDVRLAEILPLSESLAALGSTLASNLNDGEKLDHANLREHLSQYAQPDCELVLPVVFALDSLLTKTA